MKITPIQQTEEVVISKGNEVTSLLFFIFILFYIYIFFTFNSIELI